MIVDNNITRGDFEKSLKLQGLEAFTEEQVSSWVSGTRELIEKSEREELSDIEKSSIEEFKVDVLSLKRVTVVEDDLTKSTMFIRPAQVIWDITEDGEILKARSGTYANTPENKKLGRIGQKYGSKKGGEEKKETKSPNEGGEVEHKHNLKEGQLVKFEGKEHRVVEIKGNSVRLSGTQGSVHITKLFKPDGSQIINKDGEEKKGEK